MYFIPSITWGVGARKHCFKSTHRTQMEKQDAQICRDSTSLGNVLIAGELHVGTAHQSLHKKNVVGRKAGKIQISKMYHYNVAFLDL